MATYGYSGNSFDRWVGEQSLQSSDNAVNKMQHQFWVAKQTILRRLGKKEDDCVVASDAELDAKLELFLSIQETCSQLHKVVDQYQERMQVLTQEESSFGHFLRNNGEIDKTRAGKMMNAVGKAMIYSAQQRSSLRSPLARLHQEVETFCQRAVEDTSFTVNEMEKCRNDYRGALLWMKNVSQELDPDTFKQLEKFRRVQNHVRASKAKFDRHKLACLQKIDLLAAARCNMFSHGLIVYQDNMAAFWQRTSSALSTVSEAYQGYQPYEFTFVKELTETSLKLASENSPEKKSTTPEPKYEFFFESEFRDEDKKQRKSSDGDGKEASSKGKTIITSKGKFAISRDSKKDTGASDDKPLLGSATEDLLGLELSRNDDFGYLMDDFLPELASLDFSSISSSDNQLKDASTESGLGQSEQFQANFDQVFGTYQTATTQNEWNQFLPSHFLSSSMFSEPLKSPPVSAAASSTFHSSPALENKKAENLSKKVFIFKV